MLQIRNMTEADIEQVADIAADVFSDPWTQEGFKDTLPMDNVCFLVAEKDNEIVGYCGIYMAADEGEIINVAVKPQFQKQGIADKLMDALLNTGNSNGIVRYFLEVRISNQAAIHLYEKHGLTKQGIRKNFYRKPCEDAYVMNRINTD